MSYRKVSVSNGRNNANFYKKKLHARGLWKKDDETYTGSLSQGEAEDLRYLCYRWGLKFKYADDYVQRSSDYRETFFETYKPATGNKYFCAYCGRLLPRRKLTVDHIYPVAPVASNLRLQKKLKRKGYKSVNDERNLVAACDHCNKSKGTKMGLWVLKGHLGRCKFLWWIRWFLRISLFVLVVYMLTRGTDWTNVQDYLAKIIGGIKTSAEPIVKWIASWWKGTVYRCDIVSLL